MTARGCGGRRGRRANRAEGRDQREDDDDRRPRILCSCAFALMSFCTSSHRKNGPPMIAVITPTGNSMGAITVRASDVAGHEERRAEERRRRQHDPMIRADHQPHQVRHDDPDEADRAADRDGGAGRQRRAEKRAPLRAHDVDARAFPRCRRRG